MDGDTPDPVTRPWVRWLVAAGAVLAAGLLAAFAYHRGQVSAGVDAARIALERREFGVDVTGADMGAVIDRLRGTPGQVHTLVFDRKGQRISVTARVEHWM